MNNPENQIEIGIMPFFQNFAFVYVDKINRKERPRSQFTKTSGHELGHGAFGLEHPFKQHAGLDEFATNNLMSWHPTATKLCKYQWDLIQHPVCWIDGNCGTGENALMVEDGFVKYFLNSPYLVNFLKNNPEINIYSFVKSLYDEKAVFKDDYIKRKFKLNDLSVVDIKGIDNENADIIIYAYVWNDYNNHNNGYKTITLRKYKRYEVTKVFYNKEFFWDISPTYTKEDAIQHVNTKIDSLVIDYVQGLVWQKIVKLVAGKLLPTSPLMSVFQIGELNLKYEAKARLRTLGPGHTFMIKQRDASGNEGLWKIEFVGYDSNGEEIWKENNLWFNNIKWDLHA